jgi:hypothetical protein
LARGRQLDSRQWRPNPSNAGFVKSPMEYPTTINPSMVWTAQQTPPRAQNELLDEQPSRRSSNVLEHVVPAAIGDTGRSSARSGRAPGESRSHDAVRCSIQRKTLHQDANNTYRRPGLKKALPSAMARKRQKGGQLPESEADAQVAALQRKDCSSVGRRLPGSAWDLVIPNGKHGLRLRGVNSLPAFRCSARRS